MPDNKKKPPENEQPNPLENGEDSEVTQQIEKSLENSLKETNALLKRLLKIIESKRQVVAHKLS